MFRKSDLLLPLLRSVLSIYVVLSCISRFVALIPDIHPMLFDSSWRIALNYAVARGLVFGKDILFTYGPYASVYTREYNPYTDHLMLGGGLLIGLCYALLLSKLAEKVSFVWLLITSSVLVGIIIYQDVLFIFLPLLLSLLIYRLTLPQSHGMSVYRSRLTITIILLAFSGLGLLPLIKGSFIVVAVGVGIFCGGFLWYSGYKKVSVLGLCLSSICCIVLWLLAGQPFSSLGNYFVNSMIMYSGYAEAMSINGDIWQVYLFIVSALCIVCLILTQKKSPPSSRIFLTVVFITILFTIFKASFVRHDIQHMRIQGSALLLCILLINFIIKNKYVPIVIFMLMFSWIYTERQMPIQTNFKTISYNLWFSYNSLRFGAINRFFYPEILPLAYAEIMKKERNNYSVPMLSGTTDVYSVGQPDLLSSNNTWLPRPIFQSYVVYNKELALLNASHLVGKGAPNNIIFLIEPIDRRLPTLEDGLSLLTLLHNYSISHADNRYMYLKKDNDAGTMPQKTLVYSGTNQLGKSVELPSGGLLYAEIDVQKTLFGELVSAFYKPPQLHITTTLKDGTSKTFRFVASMARSGFIVTPLIENAGEFGLLFGDEEQLGDKAVGLITIYSDEKIPLSWQPRYSLKLSRLSLNKHKSSAQILIMPR